MICEGGSNVTVTTGLRNLETCGNLVVVLKMSLSPVI